MRFAFVSSLMVAAGLLIPAARAEWVDLPTTSGTLADVKKCEQRIRYTNGTYETYFELQSKGHQLGSATIPAGFQRFSSTLSRSDVNEFYYNSQVASQSLRNLFKAKLAELQHRIADVQLEVILSNSYVPQTGLIFHSAGGNDISTTYSYGLDNVVFRVQQNCPGVVAQIPRIASAVASSSWSLPAYGADKAVDGSNTTAWYGGQYQNPWTLTINLTEAVPLQVMNIVHTSSSYATSYYTIARSTDGVTWTPVLIDAFMPATVNFGGQNGKFVRISMGGSVPGGAPGISEVSFTTP